MTRKPPVHIDHEQRARVAELFAQGMSIESIAKATGRQRQSVRLMCNRMGLVPKRARDIRRSRRRKAIKSAAERVFGRLTVRDMVNSKLAEAFVCASEP